MSKPVITTAQASELRDEGFTLAEIVDQYDIDLAGAANVAASAATVPVNEELHAAAELLFAAGIKVDEKTGKPLKTRDGKRLKSHMGHKQGLGEFRVLVTVPKGYKAE